jgi:TRAP-type C4-dicarboxylate transport system permease small subunit
VDDAVYSVERAIVTGALLVMSGVVCLNILDQFLNNQQAVLRALRDGTGSVSSLWPLFALGAAGIALARAAWASAPSLRANTPLINGFTLLTLVAAGALCAAMVTLSSSTVTAALAIVCGLVVALTELDRPIASDSKGLGVKIRVAIVLALSVALAAMALRVVPDGGTWTWTQKVALFLLLWTAFIGASMAAHDGRHLTIDAVRKSIPKKFVPYYNAVSHAVAAAFSAAFMLLAYWYLQDRLAETAAPGEIPDWLKVLAIPVSLLFVTLRFAGSSIGNLLAGIWGLTEDEVSE